MSEDVVDTGDNNYDDAGHVDSGIDGSQYSESNTGNIPVEALQAERAQRQSLQEELRVIKDHLALMQSQSMQKPEVKQDEMDGYSDDDVLTVGEAKKYLSKINQQHQMSIQELKMAQKHPDYQEVVTKYLPEVIKQNPGLKKTLQDTQDFELAYYLAKQSDSYKSESKKNKRNSDAERIINNAKQAGSLGSVGSPSPINQARRYKEMSDEEFRAVANKNRGAF